MPLSPNTEASFSRYVSVKLDGLLTGAKEDIRLYASAIVSDTIQLLAEPDPDKRDKLAAELSHQAAMLGEIQRLRASNAAFDVLDRALRTGMAIVLRGLDVAL